VSEDSPGISKYLSEVPPRTPVIYTYLNPEYRSNYNLRRFRWIGISILDAIKHGSYGYTGLSQEKADEKFLKQQETIDQSEAIFTHSSYGADSIARDFNYPREKIFPIGAGASLQFKGDKNIIKSRYSRGNILFVGRDWERKGGPLVYQAFKLLKARVPHATLTIVGPSQPPVHGEGVIFEGFLRKHKYFERRRLMELFRRASIFCTPSVCETWGLVYVEAAASGLPIVGTDEWAMPDIVVNGKTGLLCGDRTAESLSNAMFEILNDPEKANQMGLNAVRHVDEVLDWPNVVDRIIAAISPSSLNGRQPKWLPQDIERNRARTK
jgi:glycosyltransferase involved in cell wall biosynthesis